MFHPREEKLSWLPLASHADHAEHTEEVQRELKELLHDVYVRHPSQRDSKMETTKDSKKKLRYSIGDHSHSARHEVHDRRVAVLLQKQHERDERKWSMRRAVYGQCLVDVKRCRAGPNAVQEGLDQLQHRLRSLEESPCESVAHYPTLQQGEGDERGSILLIREHLRAAVDLKLLFKAHERGELRLPLYLRLQIIWECAQALSALHQVGLGHGALNLTSIKVKLVSQRSKLDNYMLDYLTGNTSPTFYSAPEANAAAAHGRTLPFEHVPPADIYSFGIICFELLSMKRVCKIYNGTKSDFRIKHSKTAYKPDWDLIGSDITGEARMRFCEIISQCLHSEPTQRLSSEGLCTALDEAILLAIVPDTHQRSLWQMAIDLGTKDSRHRTKGKSKDQELLSNTSECEEEGEGDTSHIFSVRWHDLERILCKFYFGESYVQNQDVAHQDAHRLDTLFNKAKLCLYVVHHLLAEWNVREMLFLNPAQIDQLCRQWKLGRIFPVSSGNVSFKDRFVRKDVLLKRRLEGSVPLFNWLQFNKWFPLQSNSEPDSLEGMISSLVFHNYFQLVESGVEARFLLRNPDVEPGTFFVHFSRNYAHRVLFQEIDHPELSEPLAVSWVVKDTLREGLDSAKLVQTLYIGYQHGKFAFDAHSFSSLEELRDHLRSSERASLAHPYQPLNKFEFVTFVWRTYKKQVRAKREKNCSRLGLIPQAHKQITHPTTLSTVKEELYTTLSNMHPDMRDVVEDIEELIAQETSDEAIASTNTIPYKEGYLMRREKGRWRKLFAKAIDGFLVLSEREDSEEPFEIITLEGANVEAQGPDSIRLSSPLQAYIDWELTVPDDTNNNAQNGETNRLSELQKWAAALQFWTRRGFLHTSYSPVRENINCKWYIDGRDAFAAMYHAILNAKHTIFITDWRLTGEVYLMRQMQFEDCHRLDQLLKMKAEQGVKIWILLWRDPAFFSEAGSREVQKVLTQLHDNIKIMRHPYFKHIPSSSYTHHQKSLVVDYGSKDIQAFVGGIDLTWGRWDTSDHTITDYNRLVQFWPGKDYWNQEEPSFRDPFVDVLDRDRDPRMAWHDIHMSVDGEAAIDVAFNFIHRWNHHLVQLPEAKQQKMPLLPPRRNPFRTEVEVDPNVQYRLVNEKKLRPLVEERKTELGMMKNQTRQGSAASKLQQLWQRKQQRVKKWRPRRRRRLRQLRMRIRGRVVRVALRVVNKIGKVVTFPVRRFRSRAKLEQRAEKERIRKNRIDLMNAMTQHSREEEEIKSSLREQRKKKLKSKVDQKAAEIERKESLEKERQEKGTAGPVPPAQESTEEELERYEEAQANSVAQEQAQRSDAAGSEPEHDKRRKTADKRKRKQPKLPTHHSADVANHSTGSSNEEFSNSTETASQAGDLRGRLKRMITLQHSRMRLWEEKEKDKWNLLRKKWAARQNTQNARTRDLWNQVLTHALPLKIHDALHSTPPFPYPQTCAEAVKCRCQLLRSIGKWSGGNRLEQSIQEAYVSMIQRAKHFIYIENQYFISTTDNHGPCNQIAAAIVARIARAVQNDEKFRIIAVIPLVPSMASAEDLKTRIITKLQYKTIWEGKRSIFHALKHQHGIKEEVVQKYFRVYALRNYGFIMGYPVTNQVYVHAKMMLIDDREAIIGSANINDRSMEGDHDSELSVWVEDTDTVAGRMAGEECRVGKFVHSMRMNLWREHLGLHEDVKEVEVKDERHRVVGSKHDRHHKERRQAERDGINKLRHQWTSMRFAAHLLNKHKENKQEERISREPSSESTRTSESESSRTEPSNQGAHVDDALTSKERKKAKKRMNKQIKEQKKHDKELAKKLKAEEEKKRKRENQEKKEKEKQERKLNKRKNGSSDSESDDDGGREEREERERLVSTICDPMSPQALELWDSTAEANTRIYEEVFPYIPQNSISLLAEASARKRAFDEDAKTWNSEKREQIREKLKQIRGHLVQYPFYYLQGEKMLPRLVSDPVLSVMKQAFW